MNSKGLRYHPSYRHDREKESQVNSIERGCQNTKPNISSVNPYILRKETNWDFMGHVHGLIRTGSLGVWVLPGRAARWDRVFKWVK